tara:strand:+ start:47 stop:499 length:453 start_codon:yes stop_codon:yes gene_type:complete
MANKKQTYSWNQVKPGDVISFRYKSKSKLTAKVQTILVLNPRLSVRLKDGETKKHLIGVKIEESNKIELRLTPRQVDILEQVGDFINIDEENKLYKLEIKSQFLTNDVKGVKPMVYDKISKNLQIQGQYRTYDFIKARKSAVYLEPIRVR